MKRVDWACMGRTIDWLMRPISEGMWQHESLKRTELDLKTSPA